jgi:hypothetical protein
MDCEIITFEVERKVFLSCVWQGQQTLTAFGAKFLNYITLSFCTIVMHIMLGTCLSNLRGRWWVEHTQMHHALKKGTINFHYTSNSWEFFSKFTFLWNKNSNGGYEGLFETHHWMKWIWRSRCTLNLANKNWNKIKSIISMRNGRFHPPKCRGKVQKIEEKTLKGLFSKSLFLLPTFLGWCSQLLLVGTSTCPPYPYFSSNFQTPITFDP